MGKLIGKWAWAIKLAVTAAALLLVFQFVDPAAVWADISRTNPLVWFVVLALFLTGHGVAAFKWALMTGTASQFITVLKAHFAGLAANLGLPGVAGGDVVRAGLLMGSDAHKGRVVVGSVADRLIDVGALLLIASATAAVLGSEGAAYGRYLTAASVIAIIAAVIVIANLGRLAGLLRTFSAGTKAEKIGASLANAFEAAAADKGALLTCIGLSVAVQSGFALLNAALSQSMGGPSDPLLWLFAWPLAKLVATLPISIGGLGVRETSLATFFAALGVTAPEVVATGFVWQTILIGGGLFGLAIQFIGPRKAAAISETS
ncbi:lysylphosphatidylglycerol synthase transmembrane domain-containing protein [Parvularcula lutaonensis]|uniref:YbhN family protein n=1 Tax=Parvularcula lutaonensis TaxID=491923 RepID=A0ABV7M9Y1_9PROT|nr:lysylphosphatidylglycerol synthase transmembrane domain-containing protein [Parvularcula lutaonensis]GGY44453.1 hypothetical protein GCM10007148_11700 [Parvularcula lutaonensis]